MTEEMDKLAEATEEEMTAEETPDEAPPEEEAPAEEKVPEPPKATIKDATDKGKEPNPETKKGRVFYPGRTEEGGSIKATVLDFGCTVSNVRQHIAQCHTNLGFGYKIVGDRYWITGEVTNSWEDQEAIKKAEAKKVADAKKAKEEAEAKTKKEAEEEAKKVAEAQAKAESEAGDPVDPTDATHPPAGEIVDVPEEDDFLE